MNNHGTEYDLGYDLESLGDMEGTRRTRRQVRRIPYDYIAKFRLTGIPGRVVRETVNISSEARFICASIGYSLEEPPPPASPSQPPVALQIQNLRESLSFTYAIIDKGSGRELQNEPIHNLAGLGRPDGVRPFRELIVPYVFLPNSSIVIEIRELTTIADGTIHIDFQGYKEFR